MVDDIAYKILNLQHQLDRLVNEDDINFIVLSELFMQLEPLLAQIIASSSEQSSREVLVGYQLWLSSMFDIMASQKKKILSDMETLNKGRKASDYYNKNV